MRTVSHYELAEFRPAILEIPVACAMPTAPRVFSYGPLTLALHRRDYSPLDAQAVCDMLNERLRYANTPIPSPVDNLHPMAYEAATPTPVSDRGVLPATELKASAGLLEQAWESY